MKLLLEIKKEKAEFVLELLKNFKFIKTRQLSPTDVQVLEDVEDAVCEINRIKSGDVAAQPLEKFLDGL